MDPDLRMVLKTYATLFPNIWKVTNQVTQMNGTLYEKWPQWCLIPSHLLNLCLNPNDNHPNFSELYYLALTFSGLAAWRTTQGIYQYDSDVFEAVWQTPIDGNIPVEVISHLPEWCIYIPIPSSTLAVSKSEFYGFWAFLDFTFDEPPRLCLMPNVSNNMLETIAIPLEGTLEAAISKTVKIRRDADWFDHLNLAKGNPLDGVTDAELQQFVEPLVSLVLYIASQSTEIQDLRGRRHPTNPTPKRVKGELKYFPPDKQTTWTVGYRLGAALRSAQRELLLESTTTQNKNPARPHIRRAHWHTYWTGSKQKEQTPLLKWLPPIPVNLELGDIVPTIRPVTACV